ncbi:MAG: P1 family peptidase [Candidatus Cloacimonetes bacterium]|nr:P1 family peptidase [Candidatus Cloacimonadota bacterium]
MNPKEQEKRTGIRDLGITIGRFKTGKYNAITDVYGVRVGHTTIIEDGVRVPRTKDLSCVRTGVTAILPAYDSLLDRLFVAGGFILNGIGEMTGFTQVMEWGWLETPILLTNTMSIGQVHSGVISHISSKYPDLGRDSDVIIPVIGETDDSFLNDVRISRIKEEDVIRAFESARSGYIKQGSVGAGTGMTTFDFAGGIGSSSRILPAEDGGYTIGVLVLSNFGKMRNLTIDGSVVGRELDPLFPQDGRREYSYGSVIVVVATDAPLLNSQLNRLSKRAALGLGRVGSYAASTSGEIIISFSVGNKLYRKERNRFKHQSIRFINDAHINALYEGVIEATEEAVLNAMFYSKGIHGRKDHQSPPIPYDEIVKIIKQGKKINQ